jgi:phage baseplate assembly protein W
VTLRRDLAFPLRRDLSARHADPVEHLQDLIAQVLFTLPGERLNLPDFGAGVQRLVFAPLSAEATHAAQFAVRSQLQRWLGDRLQVEAVAVAELDSELTILVSYSIAGSDESLHARFTL